MREIIVHTELGTYGNKFTGLGDMVMLSWLADGARAAGEAEFKFYATGQTTKRPRLELLKLLNQKIIDSPAGHTILDPAHYDYELPDKGRQPRLVYLKEYLGLSSTATRPVPRYDELVEPWYNELSGNYIQKNKLALLFPQTMCRSREWPIAFWIDLAWSLKAQGLAPIVVLGFRDERITGAVPYWLSGLEIGQAAYLTSKASLVIGNDSFPAHLAGTLNVPTLALFGPTSPNSFGYLPSVTALQSQRPLGCEGCFFLPPLFRQACQTGCISLYTITPDEVSAKAMSLLQ